MLILIAESKTMSSSCHEVSVEEMKNNTPRFEEEALKIADHFRTLPVADLATEIGISPSLAVKASKYFYDFSFKDCGEESIKAFTGEVFKALNFNTLQEEAKQTGYADIRIISSLYGILKSADIIKPYRLEFKASYEPVSSNLIKFWKPKITVSLGKEIKDRNESEILNLLPGDASNCIDWKLLKAFAKVIRPDFKIIDDNGNLKTPNAGKLKETRGLFLRNILENKLTFEGIMNFHSNHLNISKEESKPGLPLFIIS